jgi:hypothetical protein
MDDYPGGMPRTMYNALFASAVGAGEEEADDFVRWVGYNRPVRDAAWRQNMDASDLWQQFIKLNR